MVMILSMTGYGKSERKSKNFSVNVEIKSINNRFFDPIPKILPSLKGYEQEILSILKNECICPTKKLQPLEGCIVS